MPITAGCKSVAPLDDPSAQIATGQHAGLRVRVAAKRQWGHGPRREIMVEFEFENIGEAPFVVPIDDYEHWPIYSIDFVDKDSLGLPYHFDRIQHGRLNFTLEHGQVLKPGQTARLQRRFPIARRFSGTYIEVWGGRLSMPSGPLFIECSVRQNPPPWVYDGETDWGAPFWIGRINLEPVRVR